MTKNEQIEGLSRRLKVQQAIIIEQGRELHALTVEIEKASKELEAIRSDFERAKGI